MPESIFSDQYLLDLANRGLVPLANFLLVWGVGIGSLLLVLLGLWNFGRFSSLRQSLPYEQRKKYLHGGFAGLFAGGMLFSGVTMLDIFGRTITASDLSALSYNGQRFSQIQDGGGLSFVYTVAAVIAILLFISACWAIYTGTQEKRASIGRVISSCITSGVLWHLEKVAEAAGNTLLPNLNQL